MDDNYRDMLEALNEIQSETTQQRDGQLVSIIKMGYPINEVPPDVVKALATAQEAAQIYCDALFELCDAIAATEQQEPPIPMEFLRGASAAVEQPTSPRLPTPGDKARMITSADIDSLADVSGRHPDHWKIWPNQLRKTRP